MSIFFKCPNCGRPFEQPDDAVGRTFTCDVCAAPVTVPAESQQRPVHETEFNQYKARMAVRIVFWTVVACFFGGIFLSLLPFLLPKRGPNPQVEAKLHADLQEFLAESRQRNTVANRLPETPYPNLPAPSKFTAQPPLNAPSVWVQSKTGQGPGSRMQLRIYLPPGEHAEKSLPCIVSAPLSADSFIGVTVAPSDEFPDVAPYLEAGYAVIIFSIDGQLPVETYDLPEHEFRTKFELARRRTYQACFGVTNGRNAVEYAIRKLPQVDPQRIYAAGFDAAGSIALLLAENEPRLAGCIALDPCVDVEARYDLVSQHDKLIASLAFFRPEQSPLSHPDGIKCPVFLFHREYEESLEFEETQSFAETLTQHGVDVTFVAGDTDDETLTAGMSQAIQWLEKRARLAQAEPDATPPSGDE